MFNYFVIILEFAGQILDPKAITYITQPSPTFILKYWWLPTWKTVKAENLFLDKNLCIFPGQQFLRRSISDCHIQSYIATQQDD